MKDILFDTEKKVAKLVVNKKCVSLGRTMSIVFQTADGELYGVAYNSHYEFLQEQDILAMVNKCIKEALNK